MEAFLVAPGPVVRASRQVSDSIDELLDQGDHLLQDGGDRGVAGGCTTYIYIYMIYTPWNHIMEVEQGRLDDQFPLPYITSPELQPSDGRPDGMDQGARFVC